MRIPDPGSRTTDSGSRLTVPIEHSSKPRRIGENGFEHILRRLLRTPLFTAVTVVTLAIGIGANTAIFSVVEGVLLKPLPFPDPDQLVAVDHTAPGVNLENAGSAAFLYFTYRDDSKTFQDVGIWDGDTVSVTGSRSRRKSDAHRDAGFLSMLGVQPRRAGVFREADDSPDGPERLLTNGYCRSKFGGDTSVIGRTHHPRRPPARSRRRASAAFRFLDPRAVRGPADAARSKKTFLGTVQLLWLSRV